MRHLLTNATLVTFTGPEEPRSGKDMERLGIIRDGALLMSDGVIEAVGRRDEVLARPEARKGRVYDAGGRVVLPGFVDSHTHPLFGEPRLKDFELRARGKSYREIAEEGGGILSSIHAVRSTPEAQLVELLASQAGRFLECGTTTIEAKTGYGLDKDSELKGLRAVRTASGLSALEMIGTFLGAHAVPPEYRGRPSEYVAMLSRDVLPEVASGGLARFVDAFCEPGYFSVEDSEAFLSAGAAAGLGVKVHAEQLSRSGGARLAARLRAVSADHLDHASGEDLAELKAAGTVAALTPGCNHFLGLPEYPPARRIIAAGVPVALATDFNPGSCPCWNMQEIVSLAVTRMRMTPEEALCAATVNGAWALGLGRSHGSLEAGKAADAVVYDCRDYREIPYWFGANLATAVFKKGRLVHDAMGGSL